MIQRSEHGHPVHRRRWHPQPGTPARWPQRLLRRSSNSRRKPDSLEVAIRANRALRSHRDLLPSTND